MIKLIIADDHKLIRDGLKAILSEAEAGSEFKNMIHVIGEPLQAKNL